jgi:hypothetical protein
MKTLHAFAFLVVEDLNMSRQIGRSGFETPGPEMDLSRQATAAGRSRPSRL